MMRLLIMSSLVILLLISHHSACPLLLVKLDLFDDVWFHVEFIVILLHFALVVGGHGCFSC